MVAEFGDAATIEKRAEFRGLKYGFHGYNGSSILMSSAASGKLKNLDTCWKLVKKKETSRSKKEIILRHNYYGDKILSIVAKNGSPEMIKYCCKKIGIKIQEIDKNLRSLIHNAALAGNIENLKFIWGSFFNRMRFNKIRFAKDINNNNALILASISNSPECVEFCIKKLGIPISQTGQFGRTPILAAAANGKMHNVRKIIQIIKEQPNSGSTLKDTITATDEAGRGLLEMVSQYGTKNDIEHCLSLFSHQEQLMMLSSAFRAAIGSNRIDNIKTLWAHSKNVLNDEQFSQLIDNKTVDGKNIFNIAAKEGGIHSIDFCWGHIKSDEIITPKEMIDSFYAAISGGKVENIEYIYDLLVAHINSNQIPEHHFDLLDVMKNALCVSSRHGTPESIEFITEKLSNDYSNGVLHDAMSKAILEAAASDNTQRIKKIWSICINKFSSDIVFRLDKIANAKDFSGNSILLTAARFGIPKTIEFCINDMKADYYALNDKGYDALMNAAAEGNIDNMKKISELTFYFPGQEFIIKSARASVNIATKEFKEYIYHKNALAVSAEFSNVETIRYCVDQLDMRIEANDDQKRNALVCAIAGEKFENVLAIWEIAQEKLKYDDIWQLLTTKDSNNCNAFKWADNSTNESIKSLFKEIAKVYQYPRRLNA